MDLLAYFCTLLQEAIRLYWPALAFNALVYFLWLLNERVDLPFDFKLSIGKTRIIGDSRGFIGGVLALLIGVLGSVLTQTTLPLYASLGAEFGAIAESFVKRRLGVRQGSHLLFVDESDTLIGATLFLLLATEIPLDVFLFALSFTFAGHLFFNKKVRPILESKWN
jgi:hypothetical protein